MEAPGERAGAVRSSDDVADLGPGHDRRRAGSPRGRRAGLGSALATVEVRLPDPPQGMLSSLLMHVVERKDIGEDLAV